MWPYSKKQEEKFAKIFEDVRQEPYSCFFNTLYRHGYIHVGRDHLQKYVNILKKHAMPFNVEQEDSFWYVLKIVKE